MIASFSALPARLHRVGALLELGERLLEAREPILRGLRVVLLERLALDLELEDAPLDLVDRGRHRVDFHLELRRGFVDEVDRLVGEEAVRDVAVGKRRGRDERRIRDLHAVVQLVALLEAAQDRDGVLDGRLADENGLEAALERGVLLDVLAVLADGRRADRAQVAAREGGLEHVAGVHRALGRPRADERVQLVDEEDDLAVRLLDLLEDRLEALLEFAAVLRAGEHRAEVERDDTLVLQRLGNVARDDAAREALDDRRLADPGIADEDRVVLRAAREDLHDAADLLVASDDGVELALAGKVREVLRVLLEGLVLLLGALVRDAAAAAHVLEGREDGRLGEAKREERLRGRRLPVLQEREEEVLGGDVIVLEGGGRLLGEVRQADERGGEPGLDALAGDARELPEEPGDFLRGLPGRDAHPLEERRDDTTLLLEERGHEMLGRDLRVTVRAGDLGGSLKSLLGLVGEAVRVHGAKEFSI